jgi:hypothetical protein
MMFEKQPQYFSARDKAINSNGINIQFDLLEV